MTNKEFAENNSFKKLYSTFFKFNCKVCGWHTLLDTHVLVELLNANSGLYRVGFPFSEVEQYVMLLNNIKISEGRRYAWIRFNETEVLPEDEFNNKEEIQYLIKTLELENHE